MTIFRNVVLDTNEQANAARYASGRLTLAGAGSALETLPGFSANAIVVATFDGSSPGGVGPLAGRYTAATGVLQVQSVAGAGDNGNIVNYIIVD